MLNGINIGIIVTITMLLGGIILTILINAFLVPFIKTPKNVISEIIDFMNLNKKDTFVDLGCGDGKVVLEAYRNSKCKCYGFDISPIMIILARTNRILNFPMMKDIVFEVENNFEVDMREITKTYCYLNQKSIDALQKKFSAYLNSGGELYTYRYEMKDLPAKKKVKLSNQEFLYIYKGPVGK